MSIARLRSRLRALRRDSQAAAMPMKVTGLIPAIGAIGSAIDLGRLYIVRAQMQTGVDAAALAGARSFGLDDNSAGDRDNQVSTYFGENFPAGYLGAATVSVVPSFRTESGINVTTVTASTQLPMLFMQLFGITPRPISTSATAELQPKPLEVMVVLDDTGSMQEAISGGGSAMAALKNAMLNFNNILHQGADTRAELAMGFVTYTVATNVGQILTDHGVDVEAVDGFTNVGAYTLTDSGPTNPLGWRGCVNNDQTVQNVNDGLNMNSTTDYPPTAWDITSSLPGEWVNGVQHPPVQPYHFMPVSYIQGSSTYATSIDNLNNFRPRHTQADTSDGRRNNHYLLGPTSDLSEASQGSRLANSPAYRRSFYNFYIGLNTGTASPADDVIVATDGSYYAPSSGIDGNWKVNYSRIPRITDTTTWGPPNPKYGYPINTPTRNGATLRMPTPNWQCPEPAMKVSYGRQKSAYDDYINNENFPIMPASGTLHHIGFLWGYRLLTRSDVFTRVNPIPSETPLRALVFMTDGNTAADTSLPIWSGSYGRIAEQRIATDSGQFVNQVMHRFAKVCALAKRDGIAVYIVSLGANPTQFRQCAGARYYNTTNAAQINSAFEQIAVDLVDLHLTQ